MYGHVQCFINNFAKLNIKFNVSTQKNEKKKKKKEKCLKIDKFTNMTKTEDCSLNQHSALSKTSVISLC